MSEARYRRASAETLALARKLAGSSRIAAGLLAAERDLRFEKTRRPRRKAVRRWGYDPRNVPRRRDDD